MRTIGNYFSSPLIVALTVAIGLFLPGLAGCNQNKAGKVRANRAPGGPVEPDDLVGRWKLALMQFPMEVDFCLIEISHDQKKYTVKLVTDEQRPMPLKLSGSEIKDNGQIRLDFEAMGQKTHFEGRLDGDAIWGSLLFPKERLLPVKLEPTELELKDLAPKPENMAGVSDYMNAVNSGDNYVALKEFVEKPESNRSPVLIEAYTRLARYLKSEKLSLEQIREFIAEFRKAVDVWGSRIGGTVDLEVGRALAQQKLEPELARQLLSQAEQQITDDYPIDWKIQLAENWFLLGDNAHALKLLEPLRVAYPTHPIIRFLYAQAKEQAKDFDVALKEYAGLAMLPMFERSLIEREQGNPEVVLPGQRAARLWKLKHDDSTKGFDQFLKAAYNDQMKLYVPERKPAKRPAEPQVILAELITGSACPPCVPMDIAGTAIRQAFSTDELIVIRYHVHSPLPDPLANDLCSDRAKYYGAQGTPEMKVNGLQVPNVAGTILQAQGLAKMLALTIDEALPEATSPIGIKLSATRVGDEITIKSSVSGIKSTDNDPRLILVLIENDIEFPALNGIMVHNGVARDFPGGEAGIKLKPGPVVEQTQTVSIPKVRANLSEGLKQFEDQMGREFPVKPMELKKLQVVAIVQYRITQRYVQSKLVDVTEAAQTQ